MELNRWIVPWGFSRLMILIVQTPVWKHWNQSGMIWSKMHSKIERPTRSHFMHGSQIQGRWLLLHVTFIERTLILDHLHWHTTPTIASLSMHNSSNHLATGSTSGVSSIKRSAKRIVQQREMEKVDMVNGEEKWFNMSQDQQLRWIKIFNACAKHWRAHQCLLHLIHNLQYYQAYLQLQIHQRGFM